MHTQTVNIEKSTGRQVEDLLAVEEPLEIRVAHGSEAKSVSITMRTPGSDIALAVGFLLTEGLIENREDVLTAEPCGPTKNVLKVTLAHAPKKSLDRNFYMTSSCGVCGKSSIEALRTQNQFTSASAEGPSITRDVLVSLTGKLREAQATFNSTGGLHASAIFTSSGTLLDLREDVGRHNALDKIIGHAFLARQLPLDHVVLMLSGRISFELVQKAAMAGIKFIAAVGAPSSLAVDLAREMDITLVGFLRGETFNIYNASRRLK